MRAVKSTGGKSTERRLRAALAQASVKGWTLNPTDVPGRPDVIFSKHRTAIFVDGCFWHGCPACYRRPHSSQRYWDGKLKRNRARDKRIRAELRRSGWMVLRFWEHEVERSPSACVKRVATFAMKARNG